MRFSEFVNESVVTKGGVFLLQEGIDHIEDLPPEEFIRAIRNISQMIASEKLDGSNLVFGFDTKGRFYTSREAKGGTDRAYSTNDYTSRAADNGFKAAHTALEKVAPKLKKDVNNGEAVEVEVLFGRQPNAIVYGSNYIAFIRAVPGDNGEMPDQNKIRRLKDELINDVVEVEVPITTTSDGINIITAPQKLSWKFTSVSFIDGHHFKQVDVDEELSQFEEWIKTNPPTSFKTKKAFVDAAKQFMLPIKEKFLNNVVRSLTPALRDSDVESSEDIGIEGVVLFDPQTGKQVKIVDKSVFTLINQFNYAIRNQIKGTSRFNLDNYKELYHTFEASLGVHGDSIYNDMLKRIADVAGIEGLGHYMSITRTIKRFQSAEDFIKAWKIQDVNTAKSKIDSAITEGIKDLDAAKKRFDVEWKKYKLKLKSGKEISYTDEIYNRTLMVFAETRQEMNQMLSGVRNSQTLADLINNIFGKQLKSIR